MNRRWIALILILAALPACNKKQEDTTPVATVTAIDTTPTGGTVATGTIELVAADKQFVLDAAAAIVGETAFAKTADAFSPDVAVKALGHLMVEDFAAMLADLTALGRQHGVELPTEISIEIAASNEALSKMKGKEFNRTFLQHVVTDHEAMITLFDTEAKVVADEDLRAWVAKYRPKLQAHMDEAKKLQPKFAQ